MKYSPLELEEDELDEDEELEELDDELELEEEEELELEELLEEELDEEDELEELLDDELDELEDDEELELDELDEAEELLEDELEDELEEEDEELLEEELDDDEALLCWLISSTPKDLRDWIDQKLTCHVLFAIRTVANLHNIFKWGFKSAVEVVPPWSNQFRLTNIFVTLLIVW